MSGELRVGTARQALSTRNMLDQTLGLKGSLWPLVDRQIRLIVGIETGERERTPYQKRVGGWGGWG